MPSDAVSEYNLCPVLQKLFCSVGVDPAVFWLCAIWFCLYLHWKFLSTNIFFFLVLDSLTVLYHPCPSALKPTSYLG
jgi:hypothetical protein